MVDVQDQGQAKPQFNRRRFFIVLLCLPLFFYLVSVSASRRFFLVPGMALYPRLPDG